MSNFVHILHENPEWVTPLWEQLDKLSIKYRDWILDSGLVDFEGAPPAGVFYNRISASSHTRGHRFSPELTLVNLHWLAKNGRRVLNNHNALHLEINKMAQYRALQAAGLKVPTTVAVMGTQDDVIEATKSFKQPFMLKPNRGGKGAGVFKFETTDEAANYLQNLTADELPIDGIWLVQQYVTSPEQNITRCEFIGRKFLYAVRVDTSSGFELCPADHCQIDNNCPTDANAEPNKFSIIDDFDEPALIQRYIKVMQNNGIHIAGFEFIKAANGDLYTYDLNTNTNYNSQAEKTAGIEHGGMAVLARYLGEELQQIRLP